MAKSKADLTLELKTATLNELQYLLTRYCGPHNVCLAEKVYGYSLSKKLHRLISDEIALREFDRLLVGDTE